MTAWQMSLKISGERMVKAMEKRTKQLREERALQQTKQHVQKVNSHVTESNIEVIPTFSAPSAKQFDEEKYRATIITKMIALIAKHKGITA